VTGPPPLPTERVHNVAVGQVTEWLVWSALVVGSSGDLHVFLPLDDRGIDGIVHRIHRRVRPGPGQGSWRPHRPQHRHAGARG
jgi:hypothetical protein